LRGNLPVSDLRPQAMNFRLLLLDHVLQPFKPRANAVHGFAMMVFGRRVLRDCLRGKHSGYGRAREQARAKAPR
jgi:hypothetical protein